MRRLMVLIAALLAGPAAAQQPGAALVLAVSGAVQPPFEAFDEVPAGALLRLGDDAEITLLHYAECTERRLRGGTVVVAALAMRVGRGAAVLAETPQPCPATAVLTKGDTAVGAVILRSGADPVAILAPQPTILLIGARRDAVVRLTLQADGSEPVALSLGRDGARLPAGAPPLDPARRYVLAATDAAGGQSFVACRVAPGAGLTLLAP